MPRSLLVTGFHRSGTSMTAQILARAGLYLGERLAGAHPSNPDGHFEDRDAVALHDRWLAANGCDWLCPWNSLPVQPDDALRTIEVISRRLSAEGRDWGFKDPRTCLFLPTWFEALADPYAVLVYRHYGACLDSLRRRAANALLRNPQLDTVDLQCWRDPERILRAWLAYNEALLKQYDRHPERCVLVAQQAIIEGHDLVGTLNDRFGLSLDTESDGRIDASLASDRVDPAIGTLPAPLRERLDATWSALQARALAADNCNTRTARHINNAQTDEIALEKAWDQLNIPSSEGVEWPAPPAPQPTPAESVETLRTDVEAHPDEYYRWVHYGIACSRLGQHDIAEQALRTALAQHPEHAGWWMQLGLVLAASGDRTRAVDVLEHAAALEERPVFLLHLYRHYSAGGNHAAAQRTLDRGRLTWPDDSRFLLESARLYLQNGDTAGARRMIESAGLQDDDPALLECYYQALSELGCRKDAANAWSRALGARLRCDPTYRLRARCIGKALPDSPRAELRQLWLAALQSLAASIEPEQEAGQEPRQPAGPTIQPDSIQVTTLAHVTTHDTVVASANSEAPVPHELPRIAMSILVRDEADIIADNLRFHAAMGVAHFIVTDNGSVDGTRELLDELARELSIDIIDEATQKYDQDLWVTRMAMRVHSDGGFDWIIHNDADEFWIPQQASLPEALSADLALLGDTTQAIGVLACPRWNLLPERDRLQSPDYRYHDNVHAVRRTVPLRPGETSWDDGDSNVLARVVQGKVLTRLDGLGRVAVGNHGAEHSMRRCDSPSIGIRHYPVRSYPQFERKVVNSGESLALNERFAPGICRHLRYWYRRYQEGQLGAEFSQLCFDDERLRQLDQQGYTWIDDSLSPLLQQLIPVRSRAA